ncbi:hypothetical protein [Arthrobacter sp. NPDC093139]|uniref:hypothetical protein n=1 Tax=Arthrobacter sp. NPDC093139 TaxID=3363945 RepID=UPI00380FA694
MHGPLQLPPALRRQAAVSFAGGVLALGLTGCGGAAPELKTDAATTPAVAVPAPGPASGDTARGNPGKDKADHDSDDTKGSAKDKD